MVVRFARRSVRNNILKLCKAKEVYATLRQNHLSFSEHLTPRRQVLLKKAKALAAENRIVCCWVKDGSILIRSLQDYTVVKVNTDSDLTPHEEVVPNKDLVDKYWETQKNRARAPGIPATR